MPIRPDTPISDAASSAAAEAVRWLAVADAVPGDWDDVAPSEFSIIGAYDPAEDLDRRAAKWNHRLPDHHLPSLAMFAAALARAESEAWQSDEPHLATQAYEERRFLAGDRIAHWAVPWFDTVGRCYPALRTRSHAGRDELLTITDHLRVAPDLGAVGGSVTPADDAYGPVNPVRIDGPGLRSLWSGAVILNATLVSMTGTADIDDAIRAPAHRTDLSALYWIAGGRWGGIADRHPGSAALWRALAKRADRTCAALSVG